MVYASGMKLIEPYRVLVLGADPCHGTAHDIKPFGVLAPKIANLSAYVLILFAPRIFDLVSIYVEPRVRAWLKILSSKRYVFCLYLYEQKQSGAMLCALLYQFGGFTTYNASGQKRPQL